MGEKLRGFLLFTFFLFVGLTIFVCAEQVIETSGGASGFNVSRGQNYLFNISVNNSDSGQDANITRVNVTFPTSCVFVSGSNATDSGADTFTNTSNVLSWSNSTGYVINGSEEKYFWFNASCSIAGQYNFTITTTNVTGSYSSNLSLNVIERNISSCIDVNYSGYYTLNESLNSSGTCLTIRSSDVVIDCQGNSINFSESVADKYGIKSSGYDNLTIKGCTFNQVNVSSQVKSGVFIGSSNNSVVYNNTFNFVNASGTVGYGVYIEASPNSNVSLNVINFSGGPDLVYGIGFFDGVNDSVIHANNVTTNSSNLSAGLVVGVSGQYVYGVNVTNNRVNSYGHAVSGAIAISLGGTGDLIYNNYFSSPSYDYAGISGAVPFYSHNNLSNSLNTTKTSSTNIVGRNYIGGNYWTNPSGTGYSDTCANTNSDYICDSSYALDSGNIDYLPLADHITTSEEESEDTNTGGSSISETSFWTAGTHIIDRKTFENGFTHSLSERKRIRFKVNGSDHHLGIINLTNSSALVNVSSTPQQATLLVGDERRFDVDDDKFYDILVSLNGIDAINEKANVTIVAISEKVTEQSEEEEEGKEFAAVGESESSVEDLEDESSWGWVVGVIVAVGIFVAVYFNRKNFFSKR